MSAPVAQPGILSIEPYVPGESTLPGGLKPIKLSSNESPLGASKNAIAAFVAQARRLERYPDGSAAALRQAIGTHFGLNPDRIVCGAGSDELLNLIAHAYLGPGLEAIHTAHGFLVYKIATLAHGGTPVVVPERDLEADVEAILTHVTPRTRVVWLANPNNPTGTYIPFDEVRRLRAGLPDDVVLVLDAAYAEFVRRNDYEAGIELVATTRNTVMTRTFSKIHGLAGLRLGWAYCPIGIADVLNRIRGPFNVGAPAIAAGVAALLDAEHLALSLDHNERWLGWVTGELKSLGLEVTDSVCNFVLIGFPAKGGRTAADADRHLKSRGIIVRRLEGYGLPASLRMTIGTEAENRAVVAALKDFVASWGAA